MTAGFTCVRVKADSGVESLASLEHIQSKVDLWTVPLALNTVQGILQVQPKADFLQGCPTRGVSLKTSHLHVRHIVQSVVVMVCVVCIIRLVSVASKQRNYWRRWGL